MAIDLRTRLQKFRPNNDRESETAHFLTHVPWAGSEAYLNIIFKPAPREVLQEVTLRLRIPDPIVTFLSKHNGAILFSGALSIDGVVRRGTLLNRSDSFSLPPYNIEVESEHCPPPDRERWLKFAGYGFDGSGVCIDRGTLQIDVFHPGKKEAYFSWPNFDHWLEMEITRLLMFFDARGKKLVDGHRTLPGQSVQ
jgi:hypothetical protein